MSKRNKIAYIKPREPSFITRMKQEANFKEGPTVDTKVRFMFCGWVVGKQLLLLQSKYFIDPRMNCNN